MDVQLTLMSILLRLAGNMAEVSRNIKKEERARRQQNAERYAVGRVQNRFRGLLLGLGETAEFRLIASESASRKKPVTGLTKTYGQDELGLEAGRRL